MSLFLVDPFAVARDGFALWSIGDKPVVCGGLVQARSWAHHSI